MRRPGEDDETGDSDDSLLREIARIDEVTSAEPEAARPNGSRLGRFILRGELGRGGMGIVYRADDEQLGRPVALKVLRAHTRSDPQRRARFLREARSAAALVHRNVAAVYETGEADGELYIAMELVVGESLRERLVARGGALPVAEAVLIGRGIARALAAAHAKGIVHRDLKPENVMLDASGEGEPKVLDFGLAKIHESAPTPQDVLERQPTEGLATAEGHLLGTPAYMSPEQAQGKAVDVRSDVFSFGIVLFEMLAGERPFKGDSGMSLAIAIVRDPPLDLLKARRELPRALTSVVSTCLAKAPEDRFASARELHAALESAAAAPTSSRRAGSKVALGAIAATLAISVALGLAAVDQPASPRVGARADASTSEPRSLTAYPAPATTSAAAAVAYAAGMQNLRDAAGGFTDFSRSIRIDPTFAAARLREIAPWWRDESGVVRTRADFAVAQQYRSTLDARDGALLGAAEAYTHEPVDWKEASERLRTVLARFPDDIETLMQLGYCLFVSGNRDEARTVFERTLAIDPESAQSLLLLGFIEATTDEARALALYDRCLAVSPRARLCLLERARIDREKGRCDDYEATARQLMAIEPRGIYSHLMLADALAVRGAPIEGVSVLLDNAAALESEEDPRDAPDGRDVHAIGLALLAGDLPRAVAEARDMEHLRETDTSEAAHVAPALTIIESLEEQGRPDKALQVADDFEKRSPAWTLDDDRVRVHRLFARRHAGLVDEPTFRRSLAEWEKAGTSGSRFWAYVASADGSPLDRELARPYLDTPQFNGHLEALRGRALFLAGRVEEALEPLRAGAATCEILPLSLSGEWPGLHAFTFLRSHLWLAEALEARGDTAGACTNYAVVTGRWKNAKPRSITLEMAKARSRALHCAAAP